MPNELVVSLKPLDSSDPWLVVHTETVAAMKAGLQQVVDEGLGAVIHGAGEAYQAQLVAARTLGAVPIAPSAPVEATQAVGNVTSTQTPAPVVPVAPAAAQGPACKHGAMVFRESKPGAAKQWRAYFCGSPKGTPDQCEPSWIKG